MRMHIRKLDMYLCVLACSEGWARTCIRWLAGLYQELCVCVYLVLVSCVEIGRGMSIIC